MTPLVLRWIGILFVLILVFLILRNGKQFRNVVGRLTRGQTATIVALQGGENPEQFLK